MSSKSLSDRPQARCSISVDRVSRGQQRGQRRVPGVRIRRPSVHQHHRTSGAGVVLVVDLLPFSTSRNATVTPFPRTARAAASCPSSRHSCGAAPRPAPPPRAATSGAPAPAAAPGSARRSPLAGHHDRERALLPARVRHRDDGGVRHVVVGEQGLLEGDRADPLAAALDQVLGAVDDPQPAVAVDRRDVAGAQPAVLEALRRLAEVVGGRHPRAPHVQLAAALAVPRELAAVVVDDPPPQPGEQRALRLGAPVALGRVGGRERVAGERRHRRDLGHPPALEHRHAQVLPRPDQLQRGRRAAQHERAQARDVGALCADVREQVDRDRRDHPDVGDALALDDRGDLGDRRARAGQHLRRTGHRRGERDAPGVRVEQRDDVQHGVARGDRVAVGQAGGERVQVQAAVGVADALGTARRAGGVAEHGEVVLVALRRSVELRPGLRPAPRRRRRCRPRRAPGGRRRAGGAGPGRRRSAGRRRVPRCRRSPRRTAAG